MLLQRLGGAREGEQAKGGKQALGSCGDECWSSQHIVQAIAHHRSSVGMALARE